VLDLFISQVSDVFRIGLLAALVYTTWRTSQATGIVMPLIAGAVFVAVIIPTTRAGWSWTDVGVGLISNAVILAVLLVIALIVQKARKPSA
jgi:threonine/homoserine efflux transporter RhtA